MSSLWKILAIVLPFCLPPAGAQAEPHGVDAYRLSGPAVHGNLAVYFVHAKSPSGPVPLTLQEALEKKSVELRETGRVSELEVVNHGDEEVFIQAGDIVKGGQQDRVLIVSVVVPPHSGVVRVASFCVESGRWSARAGEDVRTFSSANAVLPSRAAKMELAGAAAQSVDRAAPPAAARQQEIWRSVTQILGKLSGNLGAVVEAARSPTSLQLALENDRLGQELAGYVAALQPLGERDDDIIGYAVAINGKLNSVDIYPSNGLFRKMWPKLLRASATEAIGDRGAAIAPAPPAAMVSDFIAGEDNVRGVETQAGEHVSIRRRESARALSVEARSSAAPAGGWVHRRYLAK